MSYRMCCDCQHQLSSSNFSSNQWRKGSRAKCLDCVSQSVNNRDHTCGDCGRGFQSQHHLQQHMVVHQPSCGDCGRVFGSQHALDQHSLSHRPRNVSCPVCGDTRFADATNAVMHVESGYCRGCIGQDNARQQIYNFTRQNASHLLDQKAIAYGSYSAAAPEMPYQCQHCDRSFRQLSQMMQHTGDKHGYRSQPLPALGYS